VIAKMTIFHEEVLLRKEIGARYSNLLSEKPRIITPYIEPFNTSVYAQYTIQVEDREGIQNKLKAHGIPTAVHYPIPVHLQPAFGPLYSANQPLPIAEYAAQHVLSLPMHPYLTEEDIQKIVAVL
jgi:UDP-2-acetamido-2-deoxy-ribo-hexuluronate aminotransferase